MHSISLGVLLLLPLSTSARANPAGLPLPQDPRPAPVTDGSTSDGVQVERVALDEAFAAAADELVAPLIEGEYARHLVWGVLSDGETLTRGYGQRGPDDPRAPDGDSLYEIGSITKVFTGLLLADAVVEGHMALDDPIDQYLPEGSRPVQKRGAVPLKALASHFSGFPRMPRNLGDVDPKRPFEFYDRKLLLEGLGALRVLREPGTRYAYSNYATGLLGWMVAEHQGSDYRTLLRERILAPLGMDRTDIVLTETMEPHRTHAADSANDWSEPWFFDCLAGCGAIRSSANQMLEFGRFVIDPEDHPLAEALELTTRVPYEHETQVGLGWHYSRDRSALWHNGQTGGYHAMFTVEPEAGVAVVVLATGNSKHVEGLARQLRRLVEGEAPEPMDVRGSLTLADEALEEYVGRYQLDTNTVVDVTHRDSRLYVQLTGQLPLRIYAESDDHFYYRAVAAEVDFERDEDCKVTAFVLHQHGRVMHSPRIED